MYTYIYRTSSSIYLSDLSASLHRFLFHRSVHLYLSRILSILIYHDSFRYTLPTWFWLPFIVYITSRSHRWSIFLPFTSPSSFIVLDLVLSFYLEFYLVRCTYITGRSLPFYFCIPFAGSFATHSYIFSRSIVLLQIYPRWFVTSPSSSSTSFFYLDHVDHIFFFLSFCHRYLRSTFTFCRFCIVHPRTSFTYLSFYIFYRILSIDLYQISLHFVHLLSTDLLSITSITISPDTLIPLRCRSLSIVVTTLHVTFYRCTFFTLHLYHHIVLFCRVRKGQGTRFSFRVAVDRSGTAVATYTWVIAIPDHYTRPASRSCWRWSIIVPVAIPVDVVAC